MKIFRENAIKNGLTLITGLIFLNMSFFLFEVSLLKLNQDNNTVVNIAKLLAASTGEEEQDAFGGSEDEDASAKEVDLISNYSAHLFHAVISFDNKKVCVINQGVPRLGCYDIYSPPPEV